MSMIDIIKNVTVRLNSTRRRSVFHPAVIQKQGYLQKRRWNEKTGFNSLLFAKRYFWLKYESIEYAQHPSDKVRYILRTNVLN